MKAMRIQLDIPEASARSLKVLMRNAGVRTYSELFNSALTALYWCIKEIGNGRIIASVDETGGRYKQLSMPIFDAVVPIAEAEVVPSGVGAPEAKAFATGNAPSLSAHGD